MGQRINILSLINQYVPHTTTEVGDDEGNDEKPENLETIVDEVLEHDTVFLR